MISKPVPARSFYHTCRYILSKDGAELLASEGVRDYDYKLMAQDFESQASLRPGKATACFHSILSFPHGEDPGDITMAAIAKEYLERLKITNTQYAISKHTDQKHLHLHIVANMVDNNGESISDSWIGLRGKKAAQALTIQYGLREVQGKNLEAINLERLATHEQVRYRMYAAIMEALPKSKTIEELERRLKLKGIDMLFKLKGQTTERQGVSFRMEGYSFKGSSIDRQYSLKGLQKALEKNQQEQQYSRQDQQPAAHQSGKKGPASSGTKEESTLSDSSLSKGNEQGMLEKLLAPEEDMAAMPYELSVRAEHNKRRKKKRGRGM